MGKPRRTDMGKLDRLTKRKAQLENSNKIAPAEPKENREDGFSAAPNKKRKVMMVASRGVTHRYRHLMTDLQKMLPHSKKDAKLDLKDGVGQVNEIAEMEGCDLSMLLEVRRKEDLYIWMSKTPAGPTIKFQCNNVHTQDELKLTGNCLKGSRPLLSFDATFKEEPHFRLQAEEDRDLLEQLTATLAESGGTYEAEQIFTWFKAKLRSMACLNQGYVLDGYPETEEEAKAIFIAADDA